MTREEAIDHLSVIAERMNDKGRMIYVGDVALESVDMAIEALQERKAGKWIRADSNTTFKCSSCGNFLNFHGVNAGRGDANYCPNCGARMEADDDANDAK